MRILIVLLTLIITANVSFAEEFLLTVTTVNKFSTTGENVFEGDNIVFKTVEENKSFKKDDLITGTILKYLPNGFYNQEAQITIGNLKRQNGKKINGMIYLSGSKHQVLNEFANSIDSTFPFVRGGEIIIIPNKKTVTFSVKE